MNKIKLFSIYPALFAVSTAAFGATVVQSGNWSDSSTWGGSVPTTSFESPMDVLNFGSNNLSLDINESQYVNYIDTTSNSNSAINIDSGKSLYILTTNVNGSNVVATTAANSNLLHFSGEGQLVLGAAGKGEAFFRNGNYIFDTEVKHLSNIAYANSSAIQGSAVYNKDVNVTGQISIGGGWDITVSEGVSIVLTSAFNLWGSKSNLYLKEGASIESKGGGAWINNGIVEGRFSSMNYQNWNTNRYAMKIGNTTFTETSYLEHAINKTYSSFIVGNMVSYAGEGNLNIGTKLYIGNGNSITLNSSNALRTEGAASQGESDIYIAQQSFNVSGTIYTEYFSASNASLILGADNDFGNFYLKDSSTLNITTNGHMVNIAGFNPISEGENFTINIYNLTDFTLKLGSLDNIATEIDGDGFLRTTENFMVSSDEFFLDYAYLVKADDGGYWVNVTSAVPEPAECAIVFGALAYILARARKRFQR